MRFLTISTSIALIIFFSLNSFSQTDSSTVLIKHFLRKAKSDSLLFAGSELTPKNFLIKVPDSIYQESKIEIKKFILDNVGKVRLLVRSKSHQIYKVRYQVKGHRRARKLRDKLLKSLDMSKKQLEKAEHIIHNGHKVAFRYDQNNRYHYFLFSLKED